MAEHEDIMLDLHAAIEATPSAPCIETDNPSDMFAMRDALFIAAYLLHEAATVYDSNMRIILNDTDPIQRREKAPKMKPATELQGDV